MRTQTALTLLAAAAALLFVTAPGAVAFLVPAAGPMPASSRGLSTTTSARSAVLPAPAAASVSSRRPAVFLQAASDSHTDVGSASAAAAGDDDEEEEIIPGKMKVSEIKAELELRGVSYAGVFERNELESLLLDARVRGKARPEILDQFNEAKQTATDGNRQPDIDWESAKSGDGSLPGGVDAEALQRLTSNKELMDLMANEKLQSFMKAVMEQDMAAMQRFAADQEIMQMMQRFQTLAMEAGLDPTQFSQGGGV